VQVCVQEVGPNVPVQVVVWPVQVISAGHVVIVIQVVIMLVRVVLV
jgi:hypothetical protein